MVSVSYLVMVFLLFDNYLRPMTLSFIYTTFLLQATKERLELEEEHGCKTNKIQKMVNHVRRLEQQVHEVHEQDLKNTQVYLSSLIQIMVFLHAHVFIILPLLF